MNVFSGSITGAGGVSLVAELECFGFLFFSSFSRSTNFILVTFFMSQTISLEITDNLDALYYHNCLLILIFLSFNFL
jgi:hypothetical protein